MAINSLLILDIASQTILVLAGSVISLAIKVEVFTHVQTSFSASAIIVGRKGFISGGAFHFRLPFLVGGSKACHCH